MKALWEKSREVEKGEGFEIKERFILMSQQGQEFMDNKKRVSGKWPWKFTRMCKS